MPIPRVKPVSTRVRADEYEAICELADRLDVTVSTAIYVTLMPAVRERLKDIAKLADGRVGPAK